jgi:ferredoxin
MPIMPSNCAEVNVLGSLAWLPIIFRLWKKLRVSCLDFRAWRVQVLIVGYTIMFMAFRDARVPQNVSGKFYVDSSCIYCGLCDETAPSVFRECNEQGWAYVFKQPETSEEFRKCMEAVGGCPTQSIGIDGETGD